MRDSVVMFVAVLSSIFGVKLGKSTGKEAQHVVDILVCASVLAIWVWAMYLCALRVVRDHGNRVVYYIVLKPCFLSCVWEIYEMWGVLARGTKMRVYLKSAEVGVGSLICMWLWGTLEEPRSALSKAINELFTSAARSSAKKPPSRNE